MAGTDCFPLVARRGVEGCLIEDWTVSLEDGVSVKE